MPYEILYPWMRNPRLVKVAFWDEVDAVDSADALDAVASLMDQAMMPLHVVVDFSELTQGPDNVLDLFLHSRMVRHEKQGYCLFLNPDKFLRFIGQVLHHETGLHVEFRQDDNDAWDFFSEMGFC